MCCCGCRCRPAAAGFSCGCCSPDSRDRCALLHGMCCSTCAAQAAGACRDLRSWSAGAQLAAALRLAGNHRIVTFLDDNPAYWDRSINGVAIHPPQKLIELGDSLDQVLRRSFPVRSERRRIVDQLQSRGIPVCRCRRWMTSPRGFRIDALRPIAIEDLLGRDEVPRPPASWAWHSRCRGLRHRCWFRLVQSSAVRSWRCRRRC